MNLNCRFRYREETFYEEGGDTLAQVAQWSSKYPTTGNQSSEQILVVEGDLSRIRPDYLKRLLLTQTIS